MNGSPRAHVGKSWRLLGWSWTKPLPFIVPYVPSGPPTSSPVLPVSTTGEELRGCRTWGPRGPTAGQCLSGPEPFPCPQYTSPPGAWEGTLGPGNRRLRDPRAYVRKKKKKNQNLWRVAGATTSCGPGFNHLSAARPVVTHGGLCDSDCSMSGSPQTRPTSGLLAVKQGLECVP